MWVSVIRQLEPHRHVDPRCDRGASAFGRHEPPCAYGRERGRVESRRAARLLHLNFLDEALPGHKRRDQHATLFPHAQAGGRVGWRRIVQVSDFSDGRIGFLTKGSRGRRRSRCSNWCDRFRRCDADLLWLQCGNWRNGLRAMRSAPLHGRPGRFSCVECDTNQCGRERSRAKDMRRRQLRRLRDAKQRRAMQERHNGDGRRLVAARGFQSR